MSSSLSSILVIGKPNSGKTLLFNRLTGMNQKVANYPGVTVEVKTGFKENICFIDIPGIYSLDPLTQDEQVAVQAFESELLSERSKVILCLLDATRLEQSLLLGLAVQQRLLKEHYELKTW